MSTKLEEYPAENAEEIEKQFAVKVVEHARINGYIYIYILIIALEVYWKLLTSTKGSTLRLTRIDDEIYEHFTREFQEFSTKEFVSLIDENQLKSSENKAKWRKFMMVYENKVDNYNFGTLLRTDSRGEYEEKTTIFVPRIQFYAFEIARNHHGLNDWIYETYKTK
ncbi:hypothetical protein T552_00262 [Pneumocystis carinii B80]|uniref:Polysaccharide biosynthesis domain-containing protein n=1 Tax=Pneumocystis carinii (strain B80) TaxID=1408658 RepID=A0A0W4ZTC0_PNEC8|nr:hypothetical protein T552_00262 [Pneumocystis carinii B80]KTW31623.1 hypothetical protein T552_00262 [Pneumocystis carinii B80]